MSITVRLAAVLIIMLFSHHLSAQASDTEKIHNDTNVAEITLIPGATTYSLEKAAQGRVHFMAEISNLTGEVLVIAHPLACFPAGYKHGDEYKPQQRHGLAEIVLAIKGPSGDEIFLREGGRKFFEPGNMDYFYILPKSSKSFYVGWFFQNSSGRWEDDIAAWQAFAQPGKYEVSITYRNLLPQAAVRTDPMKKAEFIAPWNGELHSNTISIEVKE